MTRRLPSVSGFDSRLRAAPQGRARRSVAVIAAIAVLFASASAQATPSVSYYAGPVVTGTGDCANPTNPCALSDALTAAAAATGEDVTVNLAAGTYTGNGSACVSSLPTAINSGTENSLTLAGAGAAATVLSGCNANQVLALDKALLGGIAVQNLAIENGSSAGNGGNLEVDAGSVTLSGVVIQDGLATGNGGGVAVDDPTGSVTITASQVAGNTATLGGGIYIANASSVTVTSSTISANTATGAAPAGGGILSNAGTLTVERSTIANSTGDALAVLAGSAFAYGSTIAANTNGLDIGGTATLELGASVLAANGADCASGTVSDEGYNYADDTSCTSFAAPSMTAQASLALGALGAHGGPTPTIPLTGSSSAYDVIPVAAALTGDPTAGAFCAGLDARGVARTQGPASGCSPGAFQYAPPVISALSPRAALEPGLPITLTGYGFATVTSVAFGTTPAAPSAESAGSITVGVPLALGLGSMPITVTNPDGSAVVAFNAVAPPALGLTTMPPGQYKVPYSQQVAVAGGASPYSYALTYGALPGGLRLSSAGVVSGTPSKAGGAAFAVTITDANGIASATVIVSIVIATPVITIDSTGLVVSGKTVPVTLTCASAPCAGGGTTLVRAITQKVNGKLVPVNVVLASAPYSLAAGQSGTVTLTLTPAGVRAFRHAKKHHVKAVLNASLAGGTTEDEAVTVS